MRQSRLYPGIGAQCLLSMLRPPQGDDDLTEADDHRAMTGALLLSHLIHDVRQIRRLLTPPK